MTGDAWTAVDMVPTRWDVSWVYGVRPRNMSVRVGSRVIVVPRWNVLYEECMDGRYYLVYVVSFSRYVWCYVLTIMCIYLSSPSISTISHLIVVKSM